MTTEFKAIGLRAAEVKVDAASREFSGYASVFGVRDRGGDVVVKGAFATTIATRFPANLIKVFRNHYDLVGMPLELREDDHGLFVRAKLDDTSDGRDTLAQLESKSLAHMSFGYNATGVRFGEDEEGNQVRYLEKVELWEVSPVAWPMNEAARIQQLKSMRAAAGLPFGTTPHDDLLTSFRALEAASNRLAAESLTDDDLDAIREVKAGLGVLGRHLASLPRTRTRDASGVAAAAAAKVAEKSDAGSLRESLRQLLATLDSGDAKHGTDSDGWSGISG